MEIVYIVAIAIGSTGIEAYGWLQERHEATKPTPLLGAWHVVGTNPNAGALLDPERGSISDSMSIPTFAPLAVGPRASSGVRT